MILLYHSISFICNRNYANRFIIVILVIFLIFEILEMILRVYTYDVIVSKFHQNRSVSKNPTGGGGAKSPPPWDTRLRKEVLAPAYSPHISRDPSPSHDPPTAPSHILLLVLLVLILVILPIFGSLFHSVLYSISCSYT